MLYIENDNTYSQRVFIPKDPTIITRGGSTTGQTAALQSKDYQITENGTTIIHPDGGYDGISGGTISVYVSAASGVTFEHLNVTNNGEYASTGDSVYTGVTVNVDQVGPYNSGYTAGYQDGYDSGMTDGYNSGYTAGVEAGSETGYTSGFQDGYNSGYTAGLQDGGQTGYTAGYNAGYQDGYAAGSADGYQNGYTEGYNAGVAYQKSLLSNVTLTTNGNTVYANGVSAVTVNVDQVGPYNSGYTEGYGTGYDSGYRQGTTDGAATQKALMTSTTIRENGTYTRENGWNEVVVNVPITVTMTLAEYNALAVKDPSTIYLISG